MTPDIINGIFELCGGFVLALNVRRLHLDKAVKGVDWRYITFFAAWGLWNLFYYPHLGQWMSFIGGALLVGVNAIWLGQVFYYTRSWRVNNG
jgi:hypothetical protein|tara:strand:+ start:88 stop:363 length:276 start_codon:yes stop_codon:yes gene_type:complete